ncbi:acyl-CoA carboxylase subunit epsilon [Phaeacidiphilus oryzae]|jgi:hypothetical protein|uniref:acyl-CoA carboxylase subunit epsilon n=1 Tax=Phaeacidiphilus oryzae TaxID=348818 RepID=UPI000564C4F4|nr:acyl-CoA carboxylase subunit epsilon [Phaeacidiphilus oryzae]
MTPIKVLHGRPTPEEIAAVIAVVSARANAAASTPSDESGAASVWSDHARALARRAMPQPGRAAWRTSAWA